MWDVRWVHVNITISRKWTVSVPPAYSGLNTLRVEGRHFVAWPGLLTVTGCLSCHTVQQTGSYVCIITPATPAQCLASPIITTKIINYLKSQLNWAIFNWQTTIVTFSPINMRFLTDPSFLSSWFSKYCPDKWCMKTSHSSSFYSVVLSGFFAFIFCISKLCNQ